MPITLTKKAEDKVREILLEQPEPYAGLRIQVVGGGCSGFSYRMGFDKNFNDQSDSVFEFDGLKVFIDKSSLLKAADDVLYQAKRAGKNQTVMANGAK